MTAVTATPGPAWWYLGLSTRSNTNITTRQPSHSTSWRYRSTIRSVPSVPSVLITDRNISFSQVQVQAKNAFGWGKVSEQFTFRTNAAGEMRGEEKGNLKRLWNYRKCYNTCIFQRPCQWRASGKNTRSSWTIPTWGAQVFLLLSTVWYWRDFFQNGDKLHTE